MKLYRWTLWRAYVVYAIQQSMPAAATPAQQKASITPFQRAMRDALTLQMTIYASNMNAKDYVGDVVWKNDIRKRK